MSQPLFVSLIEEFCKLSNLNNPSDIVHGSPIEVDGVTFSVVYSEKINIGLLFIYCDFGEPPAGRERDAYRAVLKKNLFLHSGSGPVFTISPDTGRIVLAQHEQLTETTPGSLTERLIALSEEAKIWRKDPLHYGEAAHQATRTPYRGSAAFAALSHR